MRDFLACSFSGLAVFFSFIILFLAGSIFFLFLFHFDLLFLSYLLHRDYYVVAYISIYPRSGDLVGCF